MRRQILHLFGESPRRNPRPAITLAEAVVGDNQVLMATRPPEWGERAGDSQQIEYGSFHRSSKERFFSSRCRNLLKRVQIKVEYGQPQEMAAAFGMRALGIPLANSAMLFSAPEG